MNLGGAPEKLQQGLKTLRQRWDETADVWKDIVRDRFEEEQIVSLEGECKRALLAMAELERVLEQAVRECS